MERILNCIRSRDTHLDWGFAAAVEAGVMVDEDPPDETDLREGWWSIRDQGRTGACVGFAAADGVLRHMYVQAGWIGKRDLPSPRFIWMADKETDTYTDYPTTFLESEGAEVKQAMRVARRFGCVLEKDLPMKGRRSKLSLETFYTRAARLRIATFHNLGTDPHVWRIWIANGGPILTRLEVDSTFIDATNTKGKLTRYDDLPIHGGHAVSLVGYTKKGFIVRNSWGTDWGDGGFAYASNAYAKAAFTEAYGAVL